MESKTPNNDESGPEVDDDPKLLDKETHGGVYRSEEKSTLVDGFELFVGQELVCLWKKYTLDNHTNTDNTDFFHFTGCSRYMQQMVGGRGAENRSERF